MSDKFPPEVQEELEDIEFAGKRHFSRTTYDAGCRGPLCRMRNRRDFRANYARRRGADYKPSTETRKTLTDEALVPIVRAYIIEWYEAQKDAELEAIA